MSNKRVYNRVSVSTTLEASKNRLRAYYLTHPFTPYKKAASDLNWGSKET